MTNSLDPDVWQDVLLGLILVQTVCEGYQQTILVDKELKLSFNILEQCRIQPWDPEFTEPVKAREPVTPVL